MPDEIKGQGIAAFVILEEGFSVTPTLENELIQHVSKQIGAIAKPSRIIFTPDLPKTRSGKIMRRILKNIAEGKEIGDTTTLGNPDSVSLIQTQFTRGGTI
jgi:acetyl-CoA synthetase